MAKQDDDAATIITMAEVEELMGRLEVLERKAQELAVKESGLSQQITEGHAAGLDGKALDILAWERREAREERADVLEAIPLLEATIEERRAEACTGEAQKRMRGIARAYGSLRQELDEDVEKARAQANLYAEAVEAVNARFNALMLLRAQVDALKDRFGVAAPTLQPVVIPGLRDACREAAVIVDRAQFTDHSHRPPATEKCEHQLRVRRTYREVSGTPAATIIESAGGPKPWPPLTAKQGEIVAGRERDTEAEVLTASQFAGHADRSLSRRSL